MPCTETFATVGDYINIWKLGDSIMTNPEAIEEIETALDLGSSNVKMALLAIDACECSYPDYIGAYLKKLTVMEAAVVFKVSCGPSLSDELRETYLTWLETQMENIRSGKVDPCGYSGVDFPAVGWAEINLGEGINAPDIVLNTTMREG